MGSFGEHLRREREMRGIGLDEIATATKISTRNLKALEDEKFDQLPGGIFNKGFVRSYARFLGIDEEQIVAEYVTASKNTEEAREQRLEAEFAKAEFRKVNNQERLSLEPKSQWSAVAAIVLIGVLVFGGYSVYQKKKLQREQQVHAVPTVAAPEPQSVPPITASPDATTTAAQPDATTQDQNPTSASSTAPTTSLNSGTNLEAAKSQPAKTAVTDQTAAGNSTAQKPSEQKTSSPSPKVSSDTESAIQPIEIRVHATQDSWVSIVADGRTVLEGTLTAEQVKSVKAKEKVVLKIGNAGGVQVSFNGQQLSQLGKDQEVRTITFTPSGYQ